MEKLIFIMLFILSITIFAKAADGMINVQSIFNVKETTDRMEIVLKEKGMTIFNRIQHSTSVSKVGIKLRDTELIIFGNPKVGSLLIKCQQSVVIDLPQKALIWKDNKDKVWISYNDPRYLQKRHNIVGCEKLISKLTKALHGIAKSASTK